MDVGEPLRCDARAVRHLLDREACRRHLRRQALRRDPLQQRPVGPVRGFLENLSADRVADRGRPQRHAAPCGPVGRVGAGFEDALEALLRQLELAVRAREAVARGAGGPVERLLQEHHLAAALRAGEHLAPDRVFDAARPPVGVPRLVHPAQLLVDLAQQPLGRAPERWRVERRVVPGGDERRGGAEVVEDGSAAAEPRDRPAALPDGSRLVHEVAEVGHRAPVGAELRGDAGHPRPAETVEHHVAGVGVVQDVPHDRPVRHLGVVAVGGVHLVATALRHVGRERLAVVAVAGVVRQSGRPSQLGALHLPSCDRLGEKGVRASGVVRRVGERRDRGVVADREARTRAERWIGQRPAQASPRRLVDRGVRGVIRQAGLLGHRCSASGASKVRRVLAASWPRISPSRNAPKRRRSSSTVHGSPPAASAASSA